MKIKAIEPTPSPNTMKIILDEELPGGVRNNYKKDMYEIAPPEIKEILLLDGVKGVYHVADFLAVERHPKYDWKELLSEIRAILGEQEENNKNSMPSLNAHFGEIQVFVQFFKGIPMQIKLTDGNEERRVGLPEQFIDAISRAQLPGENIVLERKWVDKGARYGDFEQVAKDMLEEIEASFPKERLDELIKNAQNPNYQVPVSKYRKLTMEDLENPDWKKRFQALEQMRDPEIEDLPLLEKALEDEKPAIRRLATVYLGMIEDKRVLPLIYKALKDRTVAVRRTAGDCLSDLGFIEAQDAMIKALKDPSKIVRWRAAMFLYEVGDEQALPALKEAENDPEFEVALQIKMAIERIEGGEQALGSVWKQMTEARKKAKAN